MQSDVNYSNGYTRLPIKIPETILEIVSGHLFELDFRPHLKMFLADPLGYTLTNLKDYDSIYRFSSLLIYSNQNTNCIVKLNYWFEFF
ncbi:hypothetical protein BI355_2250 (plasmid) [Companilactobacillus crustorum]|nr:hypothetical protein BI355_2250 [Companilactobacillus crustorum]